MVRAHRRFDRDLVCPSCAERGYAPGKYDEHQCEECLEKFGRLKFDKRVLRGAMKRKRNKSGLVCRDCLTKLRCGKCRGACDASSWNVKNEKTHRKFSRTLVCPSCAERGYAPGKYDEHQCEECLEKFGGLKFKGQLLGAVKRQFKCRLVCRDCQAKAKHRCSKCHTAYNLKYWAKEDRSKRLSCRRPKLVCKACREQGFHSRDLQTYKCQMCACKFGARKFNQNQLHHFKYHQRHKLLCMQCDAVAKKECDTYASIFKREREIARPTAACTSTDAIAACSSKTAPLLK